MAISDISITLNIIAIPWRIMVVERKDKIMSLFNILRNIRIPRQNFLLLLFIIASTVFLGWLIIFQLKLILFIFLVIVTAIGVYIMGKYRFAVDFTFFFFGCLVVSKIFGLPGLLVFMIFAYFVPYLGAGAPLGPDAIFFFGGIILIGYLIRFFPDVRFQIVAVIAVLIFGLYDFALDLLFTGDVAKGLWSAGIFTIINLAYAVGFGRYF